MTVTRAYVEHYNTGEIETIDFIADKLGPEAFRAYVLGNIIKYASRAQHKGQFDSDIEKIRNYAVILQEFAAKLAAATEVSTLTSPAPAKIVAGSRVRVIDGTARIPTGSEYVVEKVNGGFVFLQGEDDGGWLPERFEIVTAPWPSTPRVWQRLHDVPTGVKVVDSQGDIYEYDPEDSFWRWGVNNTPVYHNRNFDAYGPFEEVIG